jgi:signal transduction histidine kinase
MRLSSLDASRACGLLALALGAAALLGWATYQPALLGVRASYIPMAPNTALAFVVLGTGLFSLASGRGSGRMLASAAAAAVGALSALRLLEYAAGLDLAVDAWFLRVPAAQVGLTPIGKMALQTAGAFLLAAIALGGLARRAASAAGAVALLPMATGMVFTLGYLFSPNSPLLYGSQSIPMALNTALGFVLIGGGLVAGAGPAAFPLRLVAGPSMRSRLLRVFLPLVVGTVGVVAWLTHVVTSAAGARTAALSAAALATAAILLFGVICTRIAGHIGGQLERAEAALRQAHDELEIKVEERTAELRRAIGGLRASYEELERAHRELTDAQGRMLQQAKLASLGRTAAGVAHEINNPLAFVTSNIAVVKRELGDLQAILRLYEQAEATLVQYQRELHARIRELAEAVDLPYVLGNLDSLLDRSREGLRRIQKIVESLRDFARLDEADYKESDLNAGIAATVDLLRGQAEGRGVALATELNLVPRLACYPAKLNLVIQSLIVNAVDACASGGRVVVRSRTVSDGAIELEVEDDGCGIDPARRERIFEPFFTTKPVGEGTGLGLAMSYGIVRDHGGTIEFESIPGARTRFVVRLPVPAAG